jgi:diguanylate cyclase (GGDEF)-like protein
VRHSDALGRIGGEEFSIFLPDTGLEGAVTLGESLRRAVEELCPQIDGKPLRITASIGVAVDRDSGRSMFEIQQEADQAMYRAKQGGRNRVTSFEG